MVECRLVVEKISEAYLGPRRCGPDAPIGICGCTAEKETFLVFGHVPRCADEHIRRRQLVIGTEKEQPISSRKMSTLVHRFIDVAVVLAQERTQGRTPLLQPFPSAVGGGTVDDDDLKVDPVLAPDTCQ